MRFPRNRITVRIREMMICMVKQFPRVCSAFDVSFLPIKMLALGAPPFSDKSSKGGYDHDKRHTDTYTGKGKSTLSGNMTNIDTVDDIVEHIDELCGNCRKCKPQKQLSDRLGS